MIGFPRNEDTGIETRRAAGRAAGRAIVARAFRGALAAAFCALGALALSACSGRLETTIRNDLSARMALRLDVPELLGARVRQIGGISSKAALFDVARLKEEFANRSSIFLVDVSAPSADSRIARRSTWVDLPGTQISTRGLGCRKLLSCTLLMKYCSIFSQTLKSAITPSFIGRMAAILPGVRPSMRLASVPTATTLF